MPQGMNTADAKKYFVDGDVQEFVDLIESADNVHIIWSHGSAISGAMDIGDPLVTVNKKKGSVEIMSVNNIEHCFSFNRDCVYIRPNQEESQIQEGIKNMEFRHAETIFYISVENFEKAIDKLNDI